MASLARLQQAREGLGSKHLGEIDARAPSWRGLEGWDAQVAASQERGDHQLDRLGGRRGSIGAREKGTGDVQESWERC
jgi:hypothetical protein